MNSQCQNLQRELKEAHGRLSEITNYKQKYEEMVKKEENRLREIEGLNVTSKKLEDSIRKIRYCTSVHQLE
jgi:hypothetical protein